MNEEQKLVSRLLAGNVEAQWAFMKRYRPRLLRISANFLGNDASEAEDIVWEVFKIALPKLSLDTFESQITIYVLLRQICLRLSYARVRDRGGS